ncbi:TetR/AcrR family transcriptional regulator [Cryptosporangium sp. NPDC051539]|uniref:TetR/AcrR family transcriptional regulator n=1 Tax=Cryptosporangium sp. NPDC051539 TaxID=3363962 RepID=UPI0037AB4747
MAGRSPRASSRDAILHVFAEHVAARGYADTSLGDVAAELGLSKGTIVHHFRSKEALLGELHVAYFGRRFAEAEFVLDQLGDPVERLVAMVYALLAAHRDDRAASLACLRELVRYFDGELNDYVRQQRTGYTEIVVGIVRDGVRRGVLHTTDPRMSALQIFGMCNYAWTWYRPDGPQSVEEIAGRFARDILGGLSHPTDDDTALGDRIATAIETVRRAPGRTPRPPLSRTPAGPRRSVSSIVPGGSGSRPGT